MGQQANKEQFKTNFGFLMAAVGSAVGLGNLWGFPYKMGNGGGFAFLILYLLLAVLVGYPCMLGEFSIGRKGQMSAIGSYEKIDRRFIFNGWIAVLTPFFLLTFYCVLGGYVIKYIVANVGDIFGASWGTNGADSESYFAGFVSSGAAPIIFTAIFIILTVFIVMKGVSGGIEKFCTVAMPGLAVLLIITVIRSCTLEGAAEGLEFIFKPNLDVFKGTGWITVLGLAGGQLFFSLSLASGCMITYGSYLDKKENLEKNAILVPIMDTSVALLAALATIPATFAAGMQPQAGPGMLFVTLQTVFNSMGAAGPIFGTIFYLLVFFRRPDFFHRYAGRRCGRFPGQSQRKGQKTEQSKDQLDYHRHYDHRLSDRSHRRHGRRSSSAFLRTGNLAGYLRPVCRRLHDASGLPVYGHHDRLDLSELY